MTSEKLMALEIKKKQEKEAQIQNMKDREEAAISVIFKRQEKSTFNFLLFRKRRKINRAPSLLARVTFSTLMTLILISTSRR